MYCTAVGSSEHGAGAGLAAGERERFVERYALGGGDTLYVDTGVYTNQHLSITGNDSGSGGSGYMTMQGSPKEGGTVLDAPGITTGFI